MHILTPIGSPEPIYMLNQAGADEFYIGFDDPSWRREFGDTCPLNRLSSYGPGTNTPGIGSVLEAIDTAHRLGAAMFVTMNSASYTDEQVKKLGTYMEILADHRVDGVIVSTPEQVMMAREKGVPAVASTMSAVYNSSIAEHYRDIGTRRIIFPREISLENMKSIIDAVPGPEYEVFLMRNGCRHADSYCLGVHSRDLGGLCYSQKCTEPQVLVRNNDHPFTEPGNRSGSEIAAGGAGEMLMREESDYLYEKVFRNNACGQCALYRLHSYGVAALKIVGRMDDPKAIAAEVSLTRRNLEIAYNCSSEEEYLRKMIMPKNRYEFCAMGTSCYYPEVRFGKER